MTRFIRFEGDIYNVSYIIRVWEERFSCSDGTPFYKTHITSHNGSENLTDITYSGQHCEEIWALIKATKTEETAKANDGRNVFVDAALSA